MICCLGARVHLFVRPEYREPFTRLFRDVLACTVHELAFGLPHPLLLTTFGDGSAFSVEFSDAAPAQPEFTDYEHAFRGPWIEFRTDDLPGTIETLHAAGIAGFSHPASPHTYFCAPGGQVFRILDLTYTGP